MAKKKDLERDKLSWYIRLITLGDRFSYQDFFDRFKKGFVEFLIVFFGVIRLKILMDLKLLDLLMENLFSVTA